MAWFLVAAVAPGRAVNATTNAPVVGYSGKVKGVKAGIVAVAQFGPAPGAQ